MGRGGTATGVVTLYTTSLHRTSCFKGWLVYVDLLLDYRVFIGNQVLPPSFCQLKHTQSLLMFFVFFAGQECVGHFFAYCMSPLYDFWEMSGFEPRVLP